MREVLRPHEHVLHVVEIEDRAVHRPPVLAAVQRCSCVGSLLLGRVELHPRLCGLTFELDRASGEPIDLGLQCADAGLDLADLRVVRGDGGVEVGPPGPDLGEVAQRRGFLRAGLADRLLELPNPRVGGGGRPDPIGGKFRSHDDEREGGDDEGRPVARRGAPHHRHRRQHHSHQQQGVANCLNGIIYPAAGRATKRYTSRKRRRPM